MVSKSSKVKPKEEKSPINELKLMRENIENDNSECSTETKTEKKSSSVEPNLPGSVPDLNKVTQSNGKETSFIIEDDCSMSSLKSSLPKDSTARLEFVKKLLTKSKIAAFDESSANRPSSAPGTRTKLGRQNQVRPLTAVQKDRQASKLTFTNPSFQSDKETESSVYESQVEPDVEVEDSKGTSDERNVESAKISEVSHFKEVAYIPYDFAQAMILRICKDMDEMRTSQTETVRKIEDHYKSSEFKKQEYYKSVLVKMKDTHKRKILQYRQVIMLLQQRNQNGAARVSDQNDVIAESKPESELLGSAAETNHEIVNYKVDIVKETLDTRKPQDVREIGPKTEKDLNEEESFKDEEIVENLNQNTENLKYVVENKEIGNIEDKKAVTQSNSEIFNKQDNEILENKKSKDWVSVEKLEKLDDVERESILADSDHEAGLSDLEDLRKTKTLLLVANKKSKDAQKRIESLEQQLANSGSNSVAGKHSSLEVKKLENKIKELQKKLDMDDKKLKMNEKNANSTVEELESTKKELAEFEKKIKSQQQELVSLKKSAEIGSIALQEVPELKVKVRDLSKEKKELVDNYNSERLLRKKYYNMLEDMKGKIRVYCRVRPLSKTEKSNKNESVVTALDDYTVKIASDKRGDKEFQFDQIFTEHHSQENVFEDTNMLIQSAVDGYNVCIFAYGQTGSGKTYTMIGDKEQDFPGIAPRAFKKIYELAYEQRKKFSFKVSCYMLELYNDKLIDLLKVGKEEQQLVIKKDKKEMVVVQGAVMREAVNAEELNEIFHSGSENRHVASTKMNAESSRSHLVVGIVIESTNLTSGAVTRGKLSLVDLAGSERVAKTGAGAEQLKEANSINKSLSALGDVISALSTEQSFVPFRNNKLTMLMQVTILKIFFDNNLNLNFFLAKFRKNGNLLIFKVANKKYNL